MECNGTIWNVISKQIFFYLKKNKHILETELKQTKQLGSFSEKIKNGYNGTKNIWSIKGHKDTSTWVQISFYTDNLKKTKQNQKSKEKKKMHGWNLSDCPFRPWARTCG